MSAEWDAEYRWWFIFQLPGGRSFVPSDNVNDARERLRKSSYVGAPVEKWPVVRSVWTSRNLLASLLLKGEDFSVPDMRFAPWP